MGRGQCICTSAPPRSWLRPKCREPPWFSMVVRTTNSPIPLPWPVGVARGMPWFGFAKPGPLSATIKRIWTGSLISVTRRMHALVDSMSLPPVVGADRSTTIASMEFWMRLFSADCS